MIGQIITKSDIEEELEKFVSENPYADTFEVAEHFANWGKNKLTTML